MVSDPRYGSAHQQARKLWEPVVAAGRAFCCETVCVNRAGRWIPPDVPGQPTGWHLAHADDGQSYKGPAHAGCNLSEAGRRGNPRGQPKRPAGKRAGAAAKKRWRPSRAWL